MSGVAHAIGKVFKGVVGIVKRVWKPLLIAAAIYFTGGAALGALGAMSAGGSVLAGAGAGLASAAGGIGIGAGAGIGGAFAAGAGTAAAEGLGGAALAAGAGGAAADIGAAATEGIAGAGTAGSTLGGMGMLEGVSGASFGGGAAAATDIGAMATAGIPGAGTADSGFNLATAGTGVGQSTAGSALPGAASSLWDKSLGVAKQVMGIPGMTQGLFGMLNGYQQGQNMQAQLQWMNDHAPGQITGGAKNAFSGFAVNPNIAAASQGIHAPNIGSMGSGSAPINMPNQQQQQPFQYAQPSYGAPYAPGMGSPSAQSYGMQGYGMPGYGVQPMANNPYQQAMQHGLMGTQNVPYLDSPYEQGQWG